MLIFLTSEYVLLNYFYIRVSKQIRMKEKTETVRDDSVLDDKKRQKSLYILIKNNFKVCDRASAVEFWQCNE